MLTSFRNPRVKDVVKLRDRRQRDRQGRFVIEGQRELACASDAGLTLEAVYYCEDLYDDSGARDLLAKVAETGVDCQQTSRAVFEKMSYRHTPDGLLGVAAAPDLSLARLPQPKDALWLVAAAIEKPGNLGAMLRCADAAGGAGVLVADPATDVFNPNVVRASVGTLFNVPVAVGTAGEVRDWLETHRVSIVAARPDADVDYTQADLRGNLAIVVGSEHDGLGSAWSPPRCEAVRIPMAGRADSVNAAVAAAVLQFESRRQRRSAAG